MSMSPEQVEELDKYQNKFLNGEITAQEYEFAKSEILWWENKNTNETTPHVRKVNQEENVVIELLVKIYKFMNQSFEYLLSRLIDTHRFLRNHSKEHGYTLWKLYWGIVLMLFVAMGLLKGIFWYISYQEERVKALKITEQKAIELQEKEKKIAEQKVIDEEKAKTPKPSITLFSSTGSQGMRTEYILKFSSTGADIVTINSEKIEPTGSGTYEKKIALGLWETSITILAKNKYFSDTLGFLVSREKTDEEIQAEKEAEEKLIAEQKEAERLALEEERRIAEKKRQELENEKKTYKPITYALLAKNPDKYKTERIRFKGKIFNADEEGGISVFQINTDGYWYWDQIFTVANWSNDYVEWNWVTVWGEVAWEYCYQSQAGWDICVPSVKANIIE